ncbi:MAG: hypothetical protein SXQ77_02415, partial [Halobacteria archaeon]|nr:hypothetical protein [Halobacteria archaeon]
MQSLQRRSFLKVAALASLTGCMGGGSNGGRDEQGQGQNGDGDENGGSPEFIEAGVSYQVDSQENRVVVQFVQNQDAEYIDVEFS